MHRISCLLILIVAVTLSYAYPSPSVPDGSTVWQSGQQVTINWVDSGSPSTSSFSGICIQLMTGPDLAQIPLTTLTPKLADTATSLPITVPQISQYGYPPGKIYFLMFSDSAKPSVGISWSTRFTILDGSDQPVVTYTPGTPWTISSGGSPATTATSTSNTTVPTTVNSTTTNTLSASASISASASPSSSNSTDSSNSTTTLSSSSLSNTVVITAFVTSSGTSTNTGAKLPTETANSGPTQNSSSNSGSTMITSLWNDGIITMIACVAFAFVI